MINRRQALRGFFVTAAATASAAVLHYSLPIFDDAMNDDTRVEAEEDFQIARELQQTAPGKTDRLPSFVQAEKGARLTLTLPEEKLQDQVPRVPVPKSKPVIEAPAVELPANVPLPVRRPADLVPAKPKAKQAEPEENPPALRKEKKTLIAKPEQPALKAPSLILAKGSVLFHNLHTAEKLSIDFRRVDTHAFDHFMRDFRRNETKHIDERLVSRFGHVVQGLRSGGGDVGQVNLISGYRSPETNAMLQKIRGGQASNSQHIYGRAMDINVPGVSLSALHKTATRVATSEGSGGVGYYPSSNFVHIDVARLRFWG